MTEGGSVNYFAVGILVFLFLIGLTRTGSKSRNLKLKPKQRRTAKTSTQASRTTIKIPQAANHMHDSMWTKVLPQARQAARAYGAALIGKGILREGEPDRPDDGPNPYGKWEITEATRARLRNLVVKAIDSGWTVNQLQHEIIVGEKLSAACALTIAWTETAIAQAHGAYEAAKEHGMRWKKWIIAEKSCAVCIANAAQGRIPINEPFRSGTDFPPGHTCCRCGVGYYETQKGD
jgi:hypothetical protein